MQTQKNGYGCGLYAVANALGLDDFVTPERLEESKNGNNIMQLNKWLQDDGHRFRMLPPYYGNDVRFKTPPLKISFENCVNPVYYPVPIVAAVKNRPKNRLFAVHIYKNLTLHVYDSLKNEPEYFLSWDAFGEKYPRIAALKIFKDFDNKEIYFAETD
jgi:hypothetical protein